MPTEPDANIGRPRFFYGWVIVATIFAINFSTMATGTLNYGLFVLPMQRELALSRASFGWMQTTRRLSAGALSFAVGRLIDRYGPRPYIPVAALMIGGCLILVGMSSHAWQFILLFALVGASGLAAPNSIVTSVPVAKWFVRMRGRAVAIASSGTAMGPLFFPFLVHGIISLVGWRDAWVVLGIGSMAIMVPLALMVRSRPEDIGLLPDGARGAETPPAPGSLRQAQSERRAERSFTRRQAMRTYAFWLLILAFFLSMLGMGGFHANWIPYFEDIGFSPAVGAWAATAYGVCSISVRMVWGVVADRFPVRYLLVVQALLTAVSITLFLNISNVPTLVIAGASHGLALGGFFILRPLIIANYFGRQHLGAINGVLRPFVTLSGAISPLLIAGMFDIFGTYREAFLLATLTWVLAAGVVFLAAPPRRRRDAREAATA